MLKVSNINITADAVQIPMDIDLQDWDKVTTYAKSYLFQRHEVTYDIIALPCTAEIPEDAIIITAESGWQLDLDMYDDLCDAPCHEGYVFVPRYLPEVYIDEALIKDTANWEYETSIDLAVFEVLQSHFIVDGDLIKDELVYEIACPQANALASLLDAAIVDADNGLDSAEMTNNGGVLADRDKTWVMSELVSLKEMFTNLVEAVDGRINMRG